MTSAKYQAAVSGRSAIANRALEIVPKHDAWSRTELAMHRLRVTKSSSDGAVLNGCLLWFQDAGLVGKKVRGRFQREEVSKKKSTVTVPAKQIEPRPPSSAPSHSLPGTLSALSGRARKLTGDLMELASDVHAAALTIDQQQAVDSTDLAELSQCKALFKSLA